MILLQVSTEFTSLQQLLDHLYDESIPQASQLIGIGRALGGLGALVFISSRIFSSISRAEPIDFFPLLRPFAIGLAILLFPQVLDVLNGILKPLSNATSSMVRVQNEDIIQLQQLKETVLAQQVEKEQFTVDPSMEKTLEAAIGKLSFFDKISYEVEKNFREWTKNVLELVYQAATLIVNTARTLFLIILSILGPLAFGFAIWPGFEGNLVNWLGRYITVSLWLPVANVFGAILAKVQVHMLQADIDRIRAGSALNAQDLGYLLFLLIGTACYFFVPTAASWVVQSTGVGNAMRPLQNAASVGAGVAGASMGRVTGAVDSVASAPSANANGYHNTQV
jgi:conjugative transposon TraJ protein